MHTDTIIPFIHSSHHPSPARRSLLVRFRRSRGVLAIAVVVPLVTVELMVGWPSLAGAMAQLTTLHWGWLIGAVWVEILSMAGFARMQRRLLRSAGTNVRLIRHIALAFAAHSLSVTLPGGPIFSTTFNFKQMRRFGATASVASWCIALSGILSTGALILIGTIGAILSGQHNSWWKLLINLGLAIALAIAVRILADHPDRLVGPAQTCLSLVNRLRRRPAAHGHDRIAYLVNQIWAVRIRSTDFAIASIFAMSNWLLDAACLWMCCRAVGATSVTATELVIAYSAGMAAASIPLVPGGLGIVDGTLIVGLVSSGMPTSSAIAADVLYRIVTLGFIIAAGWGFWIQLKRNSRTSTPVRLAQPDRADPVPVGER